MDTIHTSNRELIGQAYQEMREDIYSIFRQACIPSDECEDLVQDVFVKILKLDVIHEASVRALIVRVAYQKRIDYFRHRAYINNVYEDLRGWAMEKSYVLANAEISDILHIEKNVMKRMSNIDRKIYELSRFEEKTAEEIALTLNLSKKAIDSRLYRTRIMVRETLKKAIGY